jgi:hypothetical protein
VSQTLVGAVMRCLAKDPADRWPDAEAFARAVARPEDDESQTPPELAQFERLGILVVVLSCAALVAGLVWRRTRSPGVLELAGKILPALAVLSAVVLLAGALYARLRGYPFSVVAYYAFREPQFWSSWYPARLRSPGNVWDRLPRDVRLLRAGLGLLFALPLLVVFVAGLMTAFPGAASFWQVVPRPLRTALAAPFLAFLAAWLVSAWWVPRRLERRGLTPWEARRFALEAPLSRATFWSRPAVAALLGSRPPSESEPPATSTRFETLTR